MALVSRRRMTVAVNVVVAKRRVLLFFMCLSSLVVLMLFQFEETFDRPIPKAGRSNLLVDTPGCKLPSLDPFDPAVIRYVGGSGISTRPTCPTPLVFLVNNGNVTKLRINEKAFSNFEDKDFGRTSSCCFRTIRRVQQDPNNYTNAKADWSLDVDKHCQNIPTGPEGVVVSDGIQYAIVECQNFSGAQIWYDHFPFVPAPSALSVATADKVKFWAEQKKSPTDQQPPSILIIGIDSISRLNMLRSLPKTKSLLHSYGFEEMRGYTKVGLNTLPNTLVSIAGITRAEAKRGCWGYGNRKFDNCPFLWNNFSSVNYVTALAEDWPNLAIFNYAKAGFVVQPVDYYLRPFSVASFHAGNKPCKAGGLAEASVVLRYIDTFVQQVGGVTPFFLLSWITTPAHEDVNGLKPYDDDFRTFFDSILTSSVGDNTVIFFISDHGLRFGLFRPTFHGFYEDSLPFFFLRVPPSLQKRFPSWTPSLKVNSARLTSPWDLHATLVQLLDIASASDPVIGRSLTPQLGHSLFEVGPVTRTCNSSGIPEEHCRCGVTTDLIRSSNLSSRLGNFVVESINIKYIVNENLRSVCIPLKFTSFLYGIQVDKTDEDYIDFFIAIETFPWNAQFEAKVRLWENMERKGQKEELIGEVIRIDSYKGKGECISSVRLREYCICKNLWEAKMEHHVGVGKSFWFVFGVLLILAGLIQSLRKNEQKNEEI